MYEIPHYAVNYKNYKENNKCKTLNYKKRFFLGKKIMLVVHCRDVSFVRSEFYLVLEKEPIILL